MKDQNIETVLCLLGEGADTKAKNDEGKCALRVAMDLKFFEDVAAVLNFGIQEESSGHFWFDYTHLCTEKGNQLSLIEEITTSSDNKLILSWHASPLSNGIELSSWPCQFFCSGVHRSHR